VLFFPAYRSSPVFENLGVKRYNMLAGVRIEGGGGGAAQSFNQRSYSNNAPGGEPGQGMRGGVPSDEPGDDQGNFNPNLHESSLTIFYIGAPFFGQGVRGEGGGGEVTNLERIIPICMEHP
jgi:hypothetical protein